MEGWSGGSGLSGGAPQSRDGMPTRICTSSDVGQTVSVLHAECMFNVHRLGSDKIGMVVD